jgi:hypothetical protein
MFLFEKLFIMSLEALIIGRTTKRHSISGMHISRCWVFALVIFTRIREWKMENITFAVDERSSSMNTIDSNNFAAHEAEYGTSNTSIAGL